MLIYWPNQKEVLTNIFSEALIGGLFEAPMRLQKSKKTSKQKLSMNNTKLNGEKVNSDIIDLASGGDVGSNARKKPIVVSCVEKEDVRLAKEGQIEQDEITLSLDGRIGEAVLTKVHNFSNFPILTSCCGSVLDSICFSSFHIIMLKWITE